MDYSGHWVFGYGSLIYKIDFPYHARQLASLQGWSRRFWQGSHDHRGTPENPGRVVTLLPDPSGTCLGMAYLVDEDVFEHLDFREKNGYERREEAVELVASGESVTATVYVADRDNPAFLGGGTERELAEHIHRSHGPSGSNADYLLGLAAALREIGDHDDHVLALERELLRL